jgi:hypothetical protein
LNRITFIGFASAKVIAFFHSPKLFTKKIQKNAFFLHKTCFLPFRSRFWSDFVGKKCVADVDS